MENHISREAALELLKRYNKDPFHLRHGESAFTIIPSEDLPPFADGFAAPQGIRAVENSLQPSLHRLEILISEKSSVPSWVWKIF